MKRTLLLVINLFLVVSVMAQTPEEMYKKGKTAYDKRDYAEAVKWLQPAAEAGNADAQSELGRFYYQGLGVEQNYEMAVNWYQKAAEQGNVYAQANLGCCLAEGLGCKKDEELAAQWFREAAEQGNAIAEYCLGVFYETYESKKKDAFFEAMNQAEYWYLQAAKHNYSEAQWRLANWYEWDYELNPGANWFPHVTPEKIFFWYQKAAENGNAESQMWIGCKAYETQQYDQAVDWFIKAEKQGTVNHYKSFMGNISASSRALIAASRFMKRNIYPKCYHEEGSSEPVVIERDDAIYCSVASSAQTGLIKLQYDGSYDIVIPVIYWRLEYSEPYECEEGYFFVEEIDNTKGWRDSKHFDFSGKLLSK